jgi:hypothetical protein
VARSAGIGEKFAANPATGAGSLNVPVYTSPGRSGFGPQLSLSYDSGSGNGPFGFGWSLALPAVTSKIDKGLPQYVDAQESDIFILSGTEDLNALSGRDRRQWARDVTSANEQTLKLPITNVIFPFSNLGSGSVKIEIITFYVALSVPAAGNAIAATFSLSGGALEPLSLAPAPDLTTAGNAIAALTASATPSAVTPQSSP